jgi:hypothetical protein
MVRENIRLGKTNFTTDGVFFYSILEDSQVLQVKVDDGTVAFTYPLDTAPSYAIKELEWDGVFFWSLEDSKTGGNVDGFVIRKWAIEDSICKLINTYSFVDDATHTYRASAFSVEHYRTSVGLGNNAGFGNGYTGVDVMSEIYLYDTSRINVGDILYFVKRWTPAHRRYNTTDIEQLYVNSIISSTKVDFSTNTVVDPYSDGYGWRGKEASFSASEPVPPDEVYWTKYLWVYNDYNGKVATPALYKINAYNGSNIAQYGGTQYGSVGGATFYVKYSTDTHSGNNLTLTFNTSISNETANGGRQVYSLHIKGSSCIFFNTSTAVTDRSMIVDNVKTDTITIWPLFDMAVVGTEPDITLLRLQLGTTYKNVGGSYVDEAWATYNYDRTLIKRHAKSIAVTAEPSIVPISTVAASIVSAYVKDQYNEAIPAGVQVTFVDDDAGANSAEVTPINSGLTDVFGKATASFKSGILEKDVKVTATATWVAT